MNGIGNSILVVDLRPSGHALTSGEARAIGAEPGLHFDQLMTIERPHDPEAEAFVSIFNIDGSPAGACGNGTRCVAWALLRGSSRDEASVETASGRLVCRRLGETRFSVDMGPPRLGWADVPLAAPVADTTRVPLPQAPAPELSVFSAVGMGNPHAVFFVPDVGTIDLGRFGPAIEHNPIFPDRVNASFAEVVSDRAISLRVWERGAGATLACGSAACAAVVAGVRLGLTVRDVAVSLPGGTLDITWRAEDSHVIMAGDVELEHEGVLPSRLLDA